MKKKRNLVLIMLLLLTVVTSYVVGGTYAKYTTKVTGSDEATVAKWAWNVNGADITSADTKTFSMDLFSMSEILDSDCTQKETDIATNKGKLVAPGTCGKVTISLKNNSDVAATYGYVLSATNAGNIPLEYSVDGTTFGDLDSVNAKLATGGEVAANTSASSQTLYWRWKYTDSDQDTKDTALGFAGTAKVTLQADLTLTQKD